MSRFYELKMEVDKLKPLYGSSYQDGSGNGREQDAKYTEKVKRQEEME